MSKSKWEYRWDEPQAVLDYMQVKIPLGDFINKHKEDISFMLDKHFAGSAIKVIGDTFTIEADSRFVACECEIENLVWSGSKFNVDGVIVSLTPVFI